MTSRPNSPTTRTFGTVPESILAQAFRAPDRIAIEAIDGRLTYAEMVARAESLARHLRDLDVAPGEIVAVALPPCVDLVPALLGVHLAGAAYLPIDPDHPAARMEYMLSDSGARVLIVLDADGPDLPVAQRVQMADVGCATSTADAASGLDDPAYVIYTSGSSGRPKGVMITHDGLSNLVHATSELLELGAEVVFPAVTTVSFDIAGLEMWMPLVTGGTVVIGQRTEASNPLELADLLERFTIDVMQATPTSWRLLLAAGWRPPQGFIVLCGGERLPADLLDQLLGEGVVLWDLYGPTETTIWSSLTRYERGVPTRFHPIWETSLHVLDDRLQEVEPGGSGELYIGGRGLAVGYQGRPGLTAQRFVADPTEPGRRLYRTGDVSRWHAGGWIEILGRTDDQIKIRGFRIEPGEVEGVLGGHAGIATSAVRVEQGRNGPLLVAYLEPVDPGLLTDERDLRQHLMGSLPDYMIPARFVFLQAFPKTPNGKLDRSALPSVQPLTSTEGAPQESTQPVEMNGAGAGTTPAVEDTVAKVLAAVLERSTIDPHDDFFVLGGDSLRAVHAILQLNTTMQTQLPVSALFEMRTAYGLVELLHQDHASEPQLSKLGPGHPIRLSSRQLQQWLHQRIDPTSTLANRALAVRIPDQLADEAVEGAFEEVLERHATLRTCYPSDDIGRPVPVILPVTSTITVADGDHQVLLERAIARPFDLSGMPPVRAYLVRNDGDQRLLVVVVHEIAADHRSRALIVRQLRAAFRGRTVTPPVLEYGDFAAWQRAVSSSATAARHLEFWRTTLADLQPARLPCERTGSNIGGGLSASSVPFELGPDLVAAVRDFATDRNAPLAVGLLTGLFASVAGLTTGDDLIIGVVVDGRDQPELEHVVGMFENVTIFRVPITGTGTFDELLDRVREAGIGAMGHAMPPLEDIIGAALDESATVDVEDNRLFDVTFSLRAPTGLSDVSLPSPTDVDVALHLELLEQPDGGVHGRLIYATALFDETTVAELAKSYVEVLEAGTDPAEATQVPRLIGTAVNSRQ